jgi:F1F0 ATPase subunit 2
MNEAAYVLAAVLAGMLLGALFFGGLWWTVRRTLSSPLAGLWFSGSFLARTAVTLIGFYFVAQGDWRRMAGCVAGFLGARMVVIRFTRLPDPAGRAADSTSSFTSVAPSFARPYGLKAVPAWVGESAGDKIACPASSAEMYKLEARSGRPAAGQKSRFHKEGAQ